MCNKLVASPSLIDFHYICYQRDKTARERGRVQSEVSSGADLSCQLAWSGYEILRMHLRHFSWTSTPATLLSKYFNAVCLVPRCCPRFFITPVRGLWGQLVVRSFDEISIWRLTCWLSACLHLFPPLTLPVFLCLPVRVCVLVEQFVRQIKSVIFRFPIQTTSLLR